MTGHEAVQRPFTNIDSRNTEILRFLPSILHLGHKKMLEWNVPWWLQSGPYWHKYRHIASLWAPAHRFTVQHLSTLPQNQDQNLDVGQLELFLRCLNVTKQNLYQTLRTLSEEARHVLFPRKPVLNLARPNFLTGAIIETRFQASLPAPWLYRNLLPFNVSRKPYFFVNLVSKD